MEGNDPTPNPLPSSEGRGELERQARDLLTANTQHAARGGKTYTFSVPSPASYPFQWFWDSCFHAIVWSRFDPHRAEQELDALLTAQRPDGFVPHIVFWDRRKVARSPLLFQWQESKGYWTFLPNVPKPATSELVQPPVLAQAVDAVWRAGRSKAMLQRLVPKLNAYYRWWFAHRDPDGDHLVSITSQYESGLDASPAYDEFIGVTPGMSSWTFLLRSRRVPFFNKLFFNYGQDLLVRFGRFHVEDVLVNSILALNLGVLSDLNAALGKNEEADAWRGKAQAVTDALCEKCWDEARGAFFNLNGRGEQRSAVLTVISLMPLVLPGLPKRFAATLVERHLTNPNEFWLPYPVPSVAASEPTFSPKSTLPGRKKPFHWRGSTWMNTNWFLVQGLRRHGYRDLADHIAAKSRAMVEKSGFREYYNPYTAEGISAKNFGWSTLVADLEDGRAH